MNRPWMQPSKTTRTTRPASNPFAVAGPFRRLVVVGESNVRGGAWLAGDGERWGDILWHLIELAQESPLEYHNAGVGACVISPRSPGYSVSTKPSVAERLESEVIAHNPDLVIVACGMNDMRSGIDPNVFAGEIADLLVRLQQSLTAMVVVTNMYYMCGFNYFPPFDRGNLAAALQANELLRKVAADMNCVFADIWSAQGQCDHVIHADTVHSNKIGNLLVAHKVFEAIVHAAPGIARSAQERDANSDWTRLALERRHMQREDSQQFTK
jgi:lysophospholipase L1-like esterase